MNIYEGGEKKIVEEGGCWKKIIVREGAYYDFYNGKS